MTIENVVPSQEICPMHALSAPMFADYILFMASYGFAPDYDHDSKQKD